MRLTQVEFFLMGKLRVAILLGFWEKGLMFSGCLQIIKLTRKNHEGSLVFMWLLCEVDLSQCEICRFQKNSSGFDMF